MPEGPPNPHYPGPCGGANEPPCAPQPASPIKINNTAYEFGMYTHDEMHAYGQACYDKGRADQAQKE